MVKNGDESSGRIRIRTTSPDAQIQEKGASVSPFLVIFFPKQTMHKNG